MIKEDAKQLIVLIEDEGFHETIYYHSFCHEVEDQKFHELRKNYLKSIEEMKKYLGESL